MNHKVIAGCRFIIAVLMAVMIPLLIKLGNPLLPVFLVVFGLLFTWILTRKDQRTLVDERVNLINQKASTLSISVFLIGTTVVGLILLSLSNSGYQDFSHMAYTLMYSVCGLLALFTLFRVYYRHKFGG